MRRKMRSRSTVADTDWVGTNCGNAICHSDRKTQFGSDSAQRVPSGAETAVLGTHRKQGSAPGTWKLVGLGDPTDLSNWELFDLNADRCEVTDPAKRSPALVRELAQTWVNWAKRTGWKEEE